MVPKPDVSTPVSLCVSAVLWQLQIWKTATPDVTRPFIYSSNQAHDLIVPPITSKKGKSDEISLWQCCRNQEYIWDWLLLSHFRL